MPQKLNPRKGITLAGIDPYETSEDQRYALGTRFESVDGRVFYYAKADTTGSAAGKLCAAPDVVANHHNIAATTAAVGARSITVTLGATAATLDQYAGGYLATIAGTGAGQLYRIVSNPAADVSATLALTIDRDLAVAIASSSTKVDLYPNLYNGVQISAEEEKLHVGVTVTTVAASYYHWLQTWGPAVCLSGDTAAAGTLMDASNTAGEIKTMNEYTMDLVGVAFGNAHADGEYNLVYLKITP